MNSLIAAVFLGIIGTGYIFRDFVDGFVWTLVIGVILLALPFVVSF